MPLEAGDNAMATEKTLSRINLYVNVLVLIVASIGCYLGYLSIVGKEPMLVVEERGTDGHILLKNKSPAHDAAITYVAFFVRAPRELDKLRPTPNAFGYHRWPTATLPDGEIILNWVYDGGYYIECAHSGAILVPGGSSKDLRFSVYRDPKRSWEHLVGDLVIFQADRTQLDVRNFAIPGRTARVTMDAPQPQRPE